MRVGKRAGSAVGRRITASVVAIVMASGIWANVIQPLPRQIEYAREKAQLGRKLFFDPKLSLDGTVACVNCHHPDTGADNRPVSIGIAGQKGSANAPTVFNSVFNFRQMWSGLARSLKDQVKMPVHNPVEMAMDEKRIAAYLFHDSSYRDAFEKIYGRRPNFEDMSDAIAEFEKTLITPDSKFDRYLRQETQLTPLELQGYKLFKRLGCVTCHNGVNIGGNSFQKMGLIHPYRWNASHPDRYSLTRKERDKNIYKVPSLRNVAITAPYFHDGSVATLEEALKRMAYHNLGFDLTEDEIEALSAFLRTLTGKRPPTMDGVP
jgi:cytochrome c peroxidase